MRTTMISARRNLPWGSGSPSGSTRIRGPQERKRMSTMWMRPRSPETTSRTRVRSSPADDLQFLALFSIPGGVAMGLAWFLAQNETGMGAMTKGELLRGKSSASVDEQDDHEDMDAEGPEPKEYVLGTWITLPVGPVGATKGQQVLVPRSRNSETGELVTVSLSRPLGITFEQTQDGRIAISDLIEGGNAAKDARLKKMVQEGFYAKEGDILRGATTIQVLYGPGALAGASAPTRTWVSFTVPEGSSLPETMERLQRGRESDGAVTLVLERLAG